MFKNKMLQILSRVWNGENALSGKTAEKKIVSLLKQKFPDAKDIQVLDVSGKI